MLLINHSTSSVSLLAVLKILGFQESLHSFNFRLRNKLCFRYHRILKSSDIRVGPGHEIRLLREYQDVSTGKCDMGANQPEPPS